MASPQQPTYEDTSTSKKETTSDEITSAPLSLPRAYDPTRRRSSGLLSLTHALKQPRTDGKVELTDEAAYDKLGFTYPQWKKWGILCIIFVVQVSMNFNTSIYANGIEGMAKEFSVSKQHVRIGQMLFLVAYGFGSELWAPWSEERGRKSVLQLSLFFVNLCQIPCALANRFDIILAFRFLGGLSSAGGSVTLGMVADMWDIPDQQSPVNFVVLSSVGGSVVGPVVGGFVETHLHWRWVFWIQLILGAVTQLLHLVLVPETRATILLDKEAKRLRKAGRDYIYGPGELSTESLTIKKILIIWYRPFEMFFREPIVFWLSLFSGFSDSLIFTFLSSFGPVFVQWGFTTIQVGLTFLVLLVGYIISYFSFMPFISRDRKILKRDPEGVSPERRLYWLLWTAPLETIGLFGFAATSMGPSRNHWAAPMFFASLIAMANYNIYMATVDYMVASYGPYSASATGGNALARDILAGLAAMYATPFYENLRPEKYKLVLPSIILGALAVCVTIPIYIFYFNGPKIRARSKFAQTLESDRKERRQSGAELQKIGEV
ncbi:MAG: hypothetical protein M1814_005202 [Vezdaea aestivalis]|nr:MAG: hypothetical protein M1814_005202 [Vezdaea aestivalis]